MGQSCQNIDRVGSVSHLPSSTLNLFFLLIVTTPNWREKAKLPTIFAFDVLVPEPLNICSWRLPSITITPAPKVFTSLEQVGLQPFSVPTPSAAPNTLPNLTSPPTRGIANWASHLQITALAKPQTAADATSQPASWLRLFISEISIDLPVYFKSLEVLWTGFFGWFMLHSRNANSPSRTW